MSYGFCPLCGAPGISRERRPDGNDRCLEGHLYPSRTALDAAPAKPRLVVLESPFAGDVERNVAYARAAMADCLRRGEAPIASHLLYTQPGVLDDDIPFERKLGIDAGLAWGRVADAAVFYVDLGWSGGMQAAHIRHVNENRPIEIRSLEGWA